MTQFFLVGGAVRDLFLGNEPNDFDYVVECRGFESLIELAKCAGFLPVPNSNSASGFVEFPDTLGIKALCPELKQVVDIHCARKEFNYADGAHPEVVEIGNIKEDVARRDFTCNALLLPRGVWDLSEIIDFNKGLAGIESGVLCCVGSPLDRFLENPDRVIRALRFACRYNWALEFGIQQAFLNSELLERVRKENDDRKFKSLNKILKDKSSYRRLFCYLVDIPEMAEAIFSNIGLKATNEKS